MKKILALETPLLSIPIYSGLKTDNYDTISPIIDFLDGASIKEIDVESETFYGFHVKTHESGQRGKYQDSYYDYTITSFCSDHIVAQFCFNSLKRSYPSTNMPNAFSGERLKFEEIQKLDIKKGLPGIYRYKVKYLYTGQNKRTMNKQQFILVGNGLVINTQDIISIQLDAESDGKKCIKIALRSGTEWTTYANYERDRRRLSELFSGYVNEAPVHTLKNIKTIISTKQGRKSQADEKVLGMINNVITN